MKKHKGKMMALICALALSLVNAPQAAARSTAPELTKTSYTLTEGQSVKLTIVAGTYKIKSTEWSTSDKKVATVTKKGEVTAKKKGKATIKVKIVTKKSKKKTKKYTLKCKITVKAKPAEKPAEPGEWATATDPEIDAATAELFTTLEPKTPGITYTPIAKLAQRDGLTGTDMRYFAKETDPSLGFSQYVILEITEGSDGKASLGTINPIEKVDVVPEAADAPADSMHQCESPTLTEDDIEYLYQATADLVGAYHLPVARLFTQTASKDKVTMGILCESTLIGEEQKQAYCIIYINIKTTTKIASLDSIAAIEIA
ncbi:MAG: Ig-like domain-containing protein [Eubacterium sp.]|nr:Ig-like domain-containing protein [Eubacterium sp.]